MCLGVNFHPVWVWVISLNFLWSHLASRPHIYLHQFLWLVMLVQVFQKISYINDCLCDGVCCWHKGNFGWFWKKVNSIYQLFFPYIWDLNIVCAIDINKGFNVKPGYSIIFPWPTFSWFLMDNYITPWWSLWCPIEIKYNLNHAVWW